MDQQTMFPSPAPLEEVGEARESFRDPIPLTGRVSETDSGLLPPRAEFWSALLSAQKAARVIGHDESVEKKGGGDMYSYASAEAILEEARRLLHDHGLLVFQAMTISTSDRTKRRNVAHTTFGVVHAATGQGMLVPFEAAVHATDKFQPPKAVNAATTVSLRYFLRGLLLIRVSDEPDPEGGKPHGQPGNGAQQQEVWPPPGHYWDGYRWLPYPQQPVQPQQTYQAQGYGAPTYQAPQPVQGYQPQQPAAAPVQQQPPASVYTDPTVQAAAVALQAQPITQPQQAPAAPQQPGQAAPAQAAPVNGANRGPARQLEEPTEPTESDQWSALLQRSGVLRNVAEEFAMIPLDKPITDGLRDVIRREIDNRLGSNDAAILTSRALWEGTGFTPRPDLPVEQRPLPTARQCMRYLLKLSKHQKPTPAA